MKKMACGLLAMLALGICVQAQRRLVDGRVDPRVNQFPQLPDTTQLQWMMSPETASRPNAAGGTVSVSELKIPDGAVREMQKFEKSFHAGQLEDAAKHMEKAIKIYPDLPAEHHNLGLCYARMKEYDKAAREFEIASSLDGKLAAPLTALANVYFLQGKYAEGEVAARRALDLDPVNPAARYWVGRMLALEGQNTPEAVEMLQKSREAVPVARLVLASVLLKQNQVDAAVSELRAYLQQPDVPSKDKVECMVERLTKPAGTVSCAMK